ncbi:MAG: CHAT domain-containing protein [Bryobacteraceae bacterium]|nr:CHAT domain-containing protein [Bryobacteraceae bacterium]
MRNDVRLALGFADAACATARHVSDRRAIAEALRMRGHVSYLSGACKAAVADYSRAVAILGDLGAHVDVGRTLSSALQSVIYLGDYEKALEWAARARQIFQADGDLLRLARLDSNEANIFHRQDRFDDAKFLYERAAEQLRRLGDLDSAGIALRNLAVCHSDMYSFDAALRCYGEAESLYNQRGLARLAAEIRDNIAHLHYLRGDYLEALHACRESAAGERDNTYQLAVTRLDHSSLLLELNQFSEAARLASDAAGRFARLGIRYERGQALVNLAVASYRTGDAKRALQYLREAATRFRQERNSTWLATIDYYKAAFLLGLGRTDEARTLLADTVNRTAAGPLTGKQVSALLLLSRIELEAGRLGEASACLDRIQHQRLAFNTLPVRYQLAVQSGNLLRAQVDAGAAWIQYREAANILGIMRGQFGSDGLRISFLADKRDCHERLAEMALGGAVPCHAEEALQIVEQAKSQSLAEAMLQGPDSQDSAVASKARVIRQELSWCYREFDRIEDSPRPSNPSSPERLRSRIAALEERLSAEWSTGGIAPSPETSSARLDLSASLDADESLIEYFATGGQLYAFVARRGALQVVSLGSMEAVEQSLRMLRFQMARGVSTGAKAVAPAWLAATQAHLRRLGELLIAPLQQHLTAGHWVIVPHGVLHRLPFHALYDDGGYLISQRTISCAPSATVWQLCQSRAAGRGSEPVVFGLPDARAPQIAEELEHLRQCLPCARVFTGPDATLGRFRELAPQSGLVHLATHGVFRQDNPLFSSVRLSDGRLCLYDLYNLQLQADLVTLSGCATGVQETWGADEVMGLTRGLLIAGARAALVSLWEVNDASTARFMRSFYRGLCAGATIAASCRAAMLEMIELTPHPYYWAPFVLTGKVRISLKDLFLDSGTHPVEWGIA